MNLKRFRESTVRWVRPTHKCFGWPCTSRRSGRQTNGSRNGPQQASAWTRANCKPEIASGTATSREGRPTMRTYGYLHGVLEGAILRLKGAERYSRGDPLLGNVLEHVRGSLRQARTALDMSPAVITQQDHTPFCKPECRYPYGQECACGAKPIEEAKS